ncbi:Low-density lipoprotein receptor-related protein 4 [Amphibalanus amphitrite]|uniref:Low-density lipoprotein receptor-related protein 4 n=1 Tax=Amphibalanus amphitrite TaxID=1232801 RepID=A0A6A4VLU3_AMPAM|nr:Low-density lipoprotein receptor-related protein 4 [Amphibalanus amphitrite]
MALLTVLPALLLLLLLSGAASAAGPAPEGRSVIAVSQSGIMHLDTSGELIAWRPEVFQWWQDWHVATNPRNGTVCWVHAHEDQNENAVLRCAPIASLNDTWDLPQPPEIRLNLMDALAYDWLNENWHFTTSRVSYVCSYLFDQCVKLAEAGGNVRFYAAYDIPNRLLFRIATEEFGPYKLQVLNLDGTGLRELPTSLTYPAGLAVDPVQKCVYILDSRGGSGIDVEIYQVNYDGENDRMIAARNERFAADYVRSIDVIDGDIFVMWDDQTTVSRVSASDGTAKDLVASAVRGQTLPALAKVEKLLALRIVSPETQPQQVQNSCEDAGCQHLCVPTALNGTAGATCFCPEGEDLVVLACYKKHPAYAVVAGAESLQAVDLETEQVTEILSGLNNITDLAFFRAGDEEYLLFWLDASGISRGSWSPGAVVSSPSIVVPAAENKHILSVAIDWEHQNLVWMERDVTVKYGKSLAVKIAPFDGAYIKTVAEQYGDNQSNIIRNGCSHFCVNMLVDYRPTGKCVCPDGLALGEDMKTCE